MEPTLRMTLANLLGRGPSMLVCIIGIVLAIWMWQRAPRAAMCMTIGLVALIVVSFFQSFLQSFLFNRSLDEGWDESRRSSMMMISNVVGGISYAIALALVIVAAFLDRPRVNRAPTS